MRRHRRSQDRALKKGEIPIYEPGLADSVTACADRLHFTTDLDVALEHARLLFVAVGTPPTYSGDADLSAVYAVIDSIPAGEGDRAIVMKSTVPVGTGAAIRRELERTGKGGFAYVSCPEFLKEGAALEDFRRPDRIVVGDDGDWAGDAVVALYAPLGAPLVRTDIASAEMIKLAANAFLATKISFINEIANVCEETGADVLEVARGMGLDRRIGEHFLRPGIGYGGSCFPKDVTALKQLAGNSGYHFQLLTAVIEVNELQKRRVIAKLQKHLGSLVGKTVALLGPGVQGRHRRHARGIVAGAGGAPAGRRRARQRAMTRSPRSRRGKLMPGVEMADSALEAVDGADAIVLVTEWPEFAELDWQAVAAATSGRLIIDGRNFIDGAGRRGGRLHIRGHRSLSAERLPAVRSHDVRRRRCRH